MQYRIVPVPTSVAEEARKTGRAPGYGHPVHREAADGYGPCRTCLNPFRAGTDRRLLFTYDPFHDLEPLPLPGPIFVHEEACDEYALAGEFPAGLRFIAMTLNAYGRGRRLAAVEYVQRDGNFDAAIARLLRRDDVAYIHARNTSAGCYLFRIEPGGE